VIFGKFLRMGKIFVAKLAGVSSKEWEQFRYGAIVKFRDDVTEGRSSVSLEEELVERGCWIVNS